MCVNLFFNFCNECHWDLISFLVGRDAICFRVNEYIKGGNPKQEIDNQQHTHIHSPFNVTIQNTQNSPTNFDLIQFPIDNQKSNVYKIQCVFLYCVATHTHNM